MRRFYVLYSKRSQVADVSFSVYEIENLPQLVENSVLAPYIDIFMIL